MKAYERLSSDAGYIDGGISGFAVAIAMKADATLAEINESQQAIARRIFLRLIQFGGGRANSRSARCEQRTMPLENSNKRWST